jgi:hypothetical protein
MPFGTGPRNSKLKDGSGQHRWLRGGVKASDEEDSRDQGHCRRKFCSMGRRSCYKRNQSANG